MSKTATSTPKNGLQGLSIERRFSSPGTHPFDEVEWEIRDARDRRSARSRPSSSAGSSSRRAGRRTRPTSSPRSTSAGSSGAPERERSVKQMIGRVAGTISGWGREGGYFASAEDAEAFEAELTSILLNQKAAFNSPVWFNVGFEETPAVLGLPAPSRTRLDARRAWSRSASWSRASRSAARSTTPAA